MTTAEAIEQDTHQRQKENASRRVGIVPAKKRVVAVLTPTLGMVSMWWHTAMLDLVWPMNVGKAVIPMLDQVGGEVGETRNRLVAMALGYEMQQGVDLESIMWIDDDVIFHRMVMLQLAQHDRDIASGVYFCKGEPGGEPLIFAGGSSGTLKFKPNETFEAWGWSQGLCLIKADVYRRMQDELDLGLDKYGNPAWYKQPGFQVGKNGEITTGGTEDFHFFENASKLGYRPLIDCSKFSFGWHYDAGAKHAWPKAQWDQYVRREPVVWPAKGKAPEVVWE